MYCNCMTEIHTAGIWDPILDNYLEIHGARTAENLASLHVRKLLKITENYSLPEIWQIPVSYDIWPFNLIHVVSSRSKLLLLLTSHQPVIANATHSWTHTLLSLLLLLFEITMCDNVCNSNLKPSWVNVGQSESSSRHLYLVAAWPLWILQNEEQSVIFL